MILPPNIYAFTLQYLCYCKVMSFSSDKRSENSLKQYQCLKMLFSGFVVLWVRCFVVCCFVILLFCDFVECINMTNNQTTKQLNNQTTKQQNHLSLLIF